MKPKPIFITLLAVILMSLPPVAATRAQGETPACEADPCPTETPIFPATGTPTATVAPPTPTSTPTISPTSACADNLEPNDEAGLGAILLIDQPLGGLTLSPRGDNDYFQLWVKAGRYYQITTATPDGVDTRLHIFSAEGALIAENDDYRDGDPASQVKFQASTQGWVVVVVDSVVPIEWGCRRYNIAALDVSAPTATPTTTPAPTATSRPEATPAPTTTPPEALYDAYEPNYDFDTAANIGVGQTLSLNFQPYPPDRDVD